MKRLLLLALLGFVSLQAGEALQGVMENNDANRTALDYVQNQYPPSLYGRFYLLGRGINYGLASFVEVSDVNDQLSTLLILAGLDNPEEIFYNGDALINESALNGNILSVKKHIECLNGFLFNVNGAKAFSYSVDEPDDVSAISRMLAPYDRNNEVANSYKDALYDIYDKLQQLLPKMQASKVALENVQREALIKQSLDTLSDGSKTVTVIDRAVGGIKNAANSLYSYFWSSKPNTSQSTAAPQADDNV